MTGMNILQALTGVLVSGITAYAITLMLDFGKRKWMYIGLQLGLGLAIKVVVDCLLGLHGLNSIMEMLLAVCLTFLAENKTGEKLLAGGFSILCNCAADAMASSLCVGLGAYIGSDAFFDLTVHPELYCLCIVIMNLINAALLIALVVVWRRIVRKVKTQYILWFMLFPISQVVMIWLCMVPIVESGMGERGYILLICSSVVGIVADVAIFFAMRQLVRTSAAQQKAQFMEEQLQQQQSYYDHIVRDAETASRIRHDIRNQLQTAYTLLDEGNIGTARQQLDGITASVARAESPCKHAVVGALMSEKMAVCEEKGIMVDADLNVPADLPFDGVEMCSVFSNIMDNAINACNAPGQTEPKIIIRAGIQAGFFIVRCVNSAPAAGKKAGKRAVADEHGWGLTILEEIASRHSGRVETAGENGQFKTVVWLSMN